MTTSPHLPAIRHWDAGAYLSSICDGRSVQSLIANAGRVTIEPVRFGDHTIPVVFNDGSSDDCYVVSAEGHYVKYASFEFERMTSPVAVAARIALDTAGMGLRSLGFNRSVFINNWLLSTNPVWDPDLRAVSRLAVELSHRYQNAAVCWRLRAGEQALQTLRDLGWIVLQHRPVYWWRPSGIHRRKVSDLRRTLRQCREAGLTADWRTKLDHCEAEEVRQMYRALYIEKHSPLNADYSSDFFRVASDAGMVFLLARLGGSVVGFMSWMLDSNVIIPLSVGYKSSIDVRDVPVYRFLVASIMELSLAAERDLFLSTGNSKFKSMRGGSLGFEHEAVWIEPGHRRLGFAWRAMARLVGAVVEYGDLDSI